MEEKKEDALHPEAQFDAAFDAEPVQEPEASKEEGQLPSEETPERDAEENEHRGSDQFCTRGISASTGNPFARRVVRVIYG